MGSLIATPAAAKSAYIETYGCQMNQLDSELVWQQLRGLGYTPAASPALASLVLINTCSVRALSEQKVWSLLGRLAQLKAERPDFVVGVMGCMAEREAQALVERTPHVDLICGPSRLDAIPELLAKRAREGEVQVAISGHTSRRGTATALASDALEALDLSRSWMAANQDEQPHYTTDVTSRQAYVRITRGCNKFCSFCVVPYVRGPEAHRPPMHVVQEVQRLVDEGVREVTLLGQTVNHYHYKDGGHSTSFADLLTLVHDSAPNLRRLRFLTSYPRDFGDDALDAMASCKRICHYLHIPAQSGSNRLLRKMNRGYTVEGYEDLLARARKRMPDIRLAGDMIVGYPSETEEDHALSVALLRRAQLKSCFVFKYSPRSGTVAERRHLDDVSESDKKARNQDLLAVQSEVSGALLRERVGQTLEVLVEGEGRIRRPLELSSSSAALVQLRGASRQATSLLARTRGDEIVALDGPKSLVGQLVDVHITGASNLTLRGQWVDADKQAYPA